MEGFPKKQSVEAEQNRFIERLRASALAALVLSGIPHTKAEALEIEPSASWFQGMEQIKESVEKEKNEHHFTFVKMRDGSGEWLRVDEGTSGKAGVPLTEIGRATTEGVQDGLVDTVCIGHSHPPQEGLEHLSLPYPPSPADTRLVFATEQEFLHFDIPSEKTEFFAADQKGLWYFNQADEEDFSTTEDFKAAQAQSKDPRSSKEFLEVYFNHMKDSAKNPNVDIRELSTFADLQDAYRTKLTTSVRFVPYGELQNEPPCAGVNGG